jgi:co-chaperonin GroES (HSP10)
MKTFRPRSDRLLVRPDKPAAKRGSLQVPGAQQDNKAVTGTVLAVGKDVNRVQEYSDGSTSIIDGFTVGDRIQWAPYAQTEIVQDGETLYILRAESVHGWPEESE